MRIKIQTHSGQTDWNADVDDVDEVIVSVRHPTIVSQNEDVFPGPVFDVRFVGPKRDNEA